MSNNPLDAQEETMIQRLEAYEHYLENKVTSQIQEELRYHNLQRSLYLGLIALSLCFFAVVLFLTSRKYNDLTLWGIGICLLIFSLVNFLELDFHSKNSTLKRFFKKKS